MDTQKTITISDSAAKRIAQLIQQEDYNAFLRIQVHGGGCHGMRYSFTFDSTFQEDDRIFEKNGVKVVVDETSLEIIAGSEIDYKQDLIGAAFVLNNPQASSSCGCGNSFSI